MNVHNIPQDKKQAEIYLNGAKDALNSLYGDFTVIASADNTVNTSLDYIIIQIMKIENMLEGEDYEEAANLDHMTENQFNV